MEAVWNFITGLFESSMALYVINFILIFTVIFNERKAPSATLAWIMVLAFIPIVGFIFYLVFNQNLSRRKISRLTEREEIAAGGALKKQMSAMDSGEYEFSSKSAVRWRHLIKLNQGYGRSYYTQDNSVRLFTDGRELLENMISDIKEARETINVEYYILKADKIGRRFINVLTEKAKEGVEVRLLLDALGSRYINRWVLKDYIRAGGKIGYFFKPKFIFFGIRFNYRNHRKIVVIDDKIAYTGGYNIAKEYVGEKKKFGYWRDDHVRIEGGAVFDLNARFVMDWRFTTKENIELIPDAFYDECKGDKGIQIVSAGPDGPKEEVKRAFMRMITYAEKNVYIQTPYFVPDAPILEGLKMAAQSGVDVNVMIPCMPDHMFVYWATYSYVAELIEAGANVYIYDKGFLHAKVLAVDDEICTIGSTNFDRRSFKLNFEANAFIYDAEFTGKVVDSFEEDIKHSHRLTQELYDRRGAWIKIKEVFSRILSVVL